MTKKINALEKEVRALYAAKNPDRDVCADWLAGNHVFVVADNAAELARRFGADADLARAAGMLHDIADAEMSRFAGNHEEASLEISRRLMSKTGFTEDEIQLVVDDAVRYHSCHDGHTPASLEGKVLAAADSLAHLKTDFYIFATRYMLEGKDLNGVKQWALKKLDRDLYGKILFDDVREECRGDYELLKALFSR